MGSGWRFFFEHIPANLQDLTFPLRFHKLAAFSACQCTCSASLLCPWCPEEGVQHGTTPDNSLIFKNKHSEDLTLSTPGHNSVCQQYDGLGQALEINKLGFVCLLKSTCAYSGQAKISARGQQAVLSVLSSRLGPLT